MRWANICAFLLLGVVLEGQVTAWPYLRHYTLFSSVTAVILLVTDSPQAAARYLKTNRNPAPRAPGAGRGARTW